MADRVGKLWVMRDAPRKRNNYRNEEWIAYGVAPKEIDRIACKHTRGRFAVCVLQGINEPDKPSALVLKHSAIGLGRTEPLMIHKLRRIPRSDSPATIERVTTEDMANQLAKAARSKQILPEHLPKGSPIRVYVALVDKKPVG